MMFGRLGASDLVASPGKVRARMACLHWLVLFADSSPQGQRVVKVEAAFSLGVRSSEGTILVSDLQGAEGGRREGQGDRKELPGGA